MQALRQRGVAPHVAERVESKWWKNALTKAERKDTGFSRSQRARKLVEKVFGWGKQDRLLRPVKLRGLRRVDWLFRWLMTAHNLVRMRRLIPVP